MKRSQRPIHLLLLKLPQLPQPLNCPKLPHRLSAGLLDLVSELGCGTIISMGNNPSDTPGTKVAKLDAIAAAQGVRPFDFDRLMSGEPVMPEDESADMLIEAVHQWRTESKDRDLT
ncbi:MAG TPA: hypothetical protein VJX67_03270 [Blastocatellia bacterium]|nr:hypothetical protein [Blastocatellia bacterium]